MFSLGAPIYFMLAGSFLFYSQSKTEIKRLNQECDISILDSEKSKDKLGSLEAVDLVKKNAKSSLISKNKFEEGIRSPLLL